jgi:hypothetical protein
VKIRRDSYPRDDYLFLLPYWNCGELYKYVEKEGKIAPLENRKFKIYDHYNGREVSPPVKMAIGYIGDKIDVHFLSKLVST